MTPAQERRLRENQELRIHLRQILQRSGPPFDNSLAAQAARRVVLVGEVNPYDRPGAPPDLKDSLSLFDLPSTSAGGRLCRQILQIRPEIYRQIRRRNLCAPKWSVPAARKRASEISAALTPQDVLVLCGERVRDAFGIRGEAFTVLDLQSMAARGLGEARCRSVVIIPHPSGKCRAWNDPGAADRARNLLLELEPDLFT